MCLKVLSAVELFPPQPRPHPCTSRLAPLPSFPSPVHNRAPPVSRLTWAYPIQISLEDVSFSRCARSKVLNTGSVHWLLNISTVRSRCFGVERLGQSPCQASWESIAFLRMWRVLDAKGCQVHLEVLARFHRTWKEPWSRWSLRLPFPQRSTHAPKASAGVAWEFECGTWQDGCKVKKIEIQISRAGRELWGPLEVFVYGITK